MSFEKRYETKIIRTDYIIKVYPQQNLDSILKDLFNVPSGAILKDSYHDENILTLEFVKEDKQNEC